MTENMGGAPPLALKFQEAAMQASARVLAATAAAVAVTLAATGTALADNDERRTGEVYCAKHLQGAHRGPQDDTVVVDKPEECAGDDPDDEHVLVVSSATGLRIGDKISEDQIIGGLDDGLIRVSDADARTQYGLPPKGKVTGPVTIRGGLGGKVNPGSGGS